MKIQNKELEEKLKARREKQYHFNGKNHKLCLDNEFNPQKFMNKFMERVIKDENQQRKFSPKAEKQLLKEKIDKYSKLVKDMHPPKISDIKKKEMKALRESIVNARISTKKINLKEIKSSLNKSDTITFHQV